MMKEILHQLNRVICIGYCLSLILSFIGMICLTEARDNRIKFSHMELEMMNGLSLGALLYMIAYFCIPEKKRAWK